MSTLTSPLPTELCVQICSLATATPRTFVPLLDSIPERNEEYWRKKESLLLDVKAALSAVSKLFWAINLRYLFGILVFDIGRLSDRLSRVGEMRLDPPV